MLNIFAPDPDAVLAQRRRLLRETVLRGTFKPRANQDRVYSAALTELDTEGLAVLGDSGKLRAQVADELDPATEHDTLTAARWVLHTLESAPNRAMPTTELDGLADTVRIPKRTRAAAVRWLRDGDLCKLNGGVLRDVSGDAGRLENRRALPDPLPLRRPIPAPKPVTTTPPKPVTRRSVSEPLEPPAAPFVPYYDSFNEGTMPPPPRPKPTPKPKPAPKAEPMNTPEPSPVKTVNSTPAPAPAPREFEVLLDVQRRVKRVEEFFSPTVVDPTGVDILLEQAHPDTVNCLRRVCVLLQVYGSHQRHALTYGRISTKHKVRLPEAISLGLRVGALGLSTADGKSLTLRDHTVVMTDAELERRAAEQRARDAQKVRPSIREVLGV